MSILRLVYLIIPVLATCSQHNYVVATQFQGPDNASYYSKNSPCPVAEDIVPCICTYLEYAGEMDMDCSNISDEQQLFNVFHANLPVPIFRRLKLESINLEALSDTVFGDATFEDVQTHWIAPGHKGGTLTSVGPKTFIKSTSTLKVLLLRWNQLSTFPVETLSQYTQLTYFSLYHNPLQSFPVIQSGTLKVLYLGAAAYDGIPSGALDGLPHLEYFNVVNMDVGTMATGLFTSLPNISYIIMYNTSLTHLESLQFEVNSSFMEKIDLKANQIATVDANTFKGVQSGTIDLSHNKLTSLPEATWKPLMDAGVHLKLEGNWLTCDCEVGWLVLEPTFHVLVEDAMCHNGEMLVDLDARYFVIFC